jgi:tRNA threonylcarbamoyladenosine biosynthesis protein TsaB
MGPVLGLDTGSAAAALAIVARGRVIAESTPLLNSHGAGLPGAVARLLDEADISLHDLAGLAVGIGPGSFTGLRVGLAYIKGLALARNLPVAGIPGLDVIALCAANAAGLAPGGMVCPILDARKGDIYTALYQVGPDAIEKLSEGYQVITPAGFSLQIGDGTLLVGDGMRLELANLLEARGVRSSAMAMDALEGRGRYVAGLGASRLARGASDPVETLEPLYVRTVEKTFQSARTAPSVHDKERANGEQGRRVDSSVGGS